MSLFSSSERMGLLNRRRAIVASATCMVGISILGCDRTSPEAADNEQLDVRVDIPLRISWVGTQDDADAIRRGWSSVSEQAITIDVIPLNRNHDASNQAPDQASNHESPTIDEWIRIAKTSDVIGVPMMMIAELAAKQMIQPIAGGNIDQITSDLLPALRSGVANYGGETFAIPYAAPLPALFSPSSDDAVDMTWAAYDQRVSGEWSGRAGEPTADGWAATSFLWRCAGATSKWLVSRESFEPLIDDEAYVQTLELMKRTVMRYDQPRQTPGDIWQRLSQGDLVAGITFPTTLPSQETQWRVSDLPTTEAGVEGTVPTVFSPRLGVIAMTTHCRQTGAAKQFMQWISGGEGSQSTRQLIAPTGAVRSSDPSSPTSPYTQWLEQKLESPITLPTFHFAAASEYYAVLDRAVTRCLDGKSSASERAGRCEDAMAIDHQADRGGQPIKSLAKSVRNAGLARFQSSSARQRRP